MKKVEKKGGLQEPDGSEAPPNEEVVGTAFLHKRDFQSFRNPSSCNFPGSFSLLVSSVVPKLFFIVRNRFPCFRYNPELVLLIMLRTKPQFKISCLATLCGANGS